MTKSQLRFLAMFILFLPLTLLAIAEIVYFLAKGEWIFLAIMAAIALIIFGCSAIGIHLKELADKRKD